MFIFLNIFIKALVLISVSNFNNKINYKTIGISIFIAFVISIYAFSDGAGVRSVDNSATFIVWNFFLGGWISISYVYLTDKESLFKWLVDIHNRVNVKNNKREYSYDEVTELYEKMYSKSGDNTYGKSGDTSGSKLIGNKWLFILLIILLIILGIYHYRK